MFGGKGIMKSKIVVSKIRSKIANYVSILGHEDKDVNCLQNAGKVLLITLNI